MVEITHRGIKLPPQLFQTNALPIFRIISKAADEKQWFETITFDIVKFLRNLGTPNVKIDQNVRYLLLVFCPNLPSGLQRSEFDQEFYVQLGLSVCEIYKNFKFSFFS